MPRILVLTAAVIAAAVAVPSVANGAIVQQNGKQRILVQDVPGEGNLVRVEGSKAVTITDDGTPITLNRVPGCMKIDSRAVRCTNVRAIDLDLGDGPDVANIATSKIVSVDAGRGNDTYLATAPDGMPTRVNYSGGDGVDVANYHHATSGVDVTVDRESGDGRPGDDDQILFDVERVFGSEHEDVLSGGDRTLQLLGMGGDDQITGGTAEELLAGGEGNDRIDARDGMLDTVDCGGWLQDFAATDIIEASVTGCAEVVSG
jgi:hypothetical protein